MQYPFGRNLDQNNKFVICLIDSVMGGIPKGTSQLYLPTPEDLANIQDSSFDLKEDNPKGKFANNKLFNFEHGLQYLKQFNNQPELILELNKKFRELNLSNDLKTLAKQILIEKTIDYEFKILNNN